jgi:hypothetical protein
MNLPTTTNFMNISGDVYGDLVVVSYSGKRGAKHYWNCRCVCGTDKAVSIQALRSGATRSCGCLHRRTLTTHGYSYKAEYRSWQQLLNRCLNARNKGYPRYGGRGITVCERWQHSFENFIADMGPKPSPAHSIDRIDVDGNYEPENCRWATMQQQSENRRNSRFLTVNGETRCVAVWARRLGISPQSLYSRIDRGWSPEDAVSLPANPSQRYAKD